jgi:hypothetical protein
MEIEEFRKATREEMKWLLSGLSVVSAHGRFVGGRLCAVEFAPMSLGDTRFGFRFVLPGIRPQVPQATLDKGIREMEKMLDTPTVKSDSGARNSIFTCIEKLKLPRITVEDIQGWEIELLLDGKVVASATTDAQGSCIFEGVNRETTYTVQVRKE